MAHSHISRKIKTYTLLFCIILFITFAIIGMFFTLVFIGMQYGWFNVKGTIQERNSFYSEATTTKEHILPVLETPPHTCESFAKECAWQNTSEWATVKEGLLKDQDVINRVAQETGIPPRLLVSVAVPEQLRFFTSERETFKKYFEPLKLLGSMSQFSLGVTGIKPDTAKNIELYANTFSSPFYPGDTYASLITYPATTKPDDERFNRLTQFRDHYYSFLYTALFIKEIEAQWDKAGFPIENNPGIIVTIFNLGFTKSIPKEMPIVGGAPVIVGANMYSYGELGQDFYNSDEMEDVFPR